MKSFTSTPAGKVLLNTVSADNQYSLQDTSSFSNPYKYYEIIFDNVSPTVASAQLCMQYYVDGGWLADQNYNNLTYSMDMGGNGADGFTGDCFQIWGTNRSGPNNESGIFGKLSLFDPLNTYANKSYVAECMLPVPSIIRAA